MGNWYVTIPETTTNLFHDPQFALPYPNAAAGGQWTVAGPNAPPDNVTQDHTAQFYGIGCALFTMAGANLDLTWSVNVVNEPYTMSWRIRRAAGGVVTSAQCQAHFDTANVDWDSITHIRDGWYLCTITATATAGWRFFGLHCLETGLQADGAQLEHLAYRTTYCDGTQLGCEWTLGAHTSTSTRSALETRGGRLVDLEDYELYVRDSLGAGMPPVQNIAARYGQQPGGEFQRQNVQPRVLTLVGAIVGDSRGDLHSLRESIIDALKIDRSPVGLPVRLWHDNGTSTVYIDCQYEDGLQLGATRGTGAERVAIRLMAGDPFFYHDGDISTVLDFNDAPTLRYLAARIKATGQWDDLGRVADPAVGGTIYDIKFNPHDGRIYVGGNFTDFFNDASGADYAVVYDPSETTGANGWHRLGAANAVSASVSAIAIAPNGDVYVGGAFTILGGSAGDYIMYWDISAGAWAAVAAGGTPNVTALEFDMEGNLYIGGSFINWNAIANADKMVVWDGAAYAALDANILNGNVQEIMTHPDGTVYIGGQFTQFGANVCYYWCSYDGTSYAIVDTGLDNSVYALDISESGDIYLGGLFTVHGGYIARWDGQQFNALGTGTNLSVYSIKIAPDGMVYAGGTFTEAGGIILADRVAKWNGYTWAHLDANLPGAPQINTIEICHPDPIVKQNYDVYLGFTTTGAAEVAGSATVTNDGCRTAYPHTIQIATVEWVAPGTVALEEIRNETTGRELLFDYDILNGETVLIHLEPGNRYMESTRTGRRWQTLPASDVADFCLLPGANNVTMFMSLTGNGAAEAYLLFRQAEWSVDE